MKTLKDFTPEIKAKIPEYIERYTKGVFDGGRYNAFKFESAQNAVFHTYGKCGYKKPVILVAGNPYEAQIIFNYVKASPDLRLLVWANYCLLNNNVNMDQLDSQLGSQLDKKLFHRNEQYIYTLDIYSNWYFSWYNFIVNEFKIDSTINKDLEVYSSLYEASNIYNTIVSEALCVVSKYPKKVYRDNVLNLHNPSGQAVEWESICHETNFDGYYIHGRSLPKWIWDKAVSGEITKDMFLKESNEEIKAGIYEVVGQAKMMDLLGAYVYDETEITHANGDVETVILYKTKQKFKEIDNKPFAWVKIICPSTGTNYLLGVEPHHNRAKDALASLSMFDASEYSFNFRA